MADLQLRNLVKRFGDITVVQQLDLAVAGGEFVVLLGESGCGKSTTLRMVAGLEEVTEGQVLIGGRDVTHAHPMARDIAMVFQNYALYPHMNVAQNMSFALRLAGRPAAETEAKVAAAAKVLNIEHLLARKPKELSGGQRQRVAIGRAIVREPQVFLFDEPLSNLDAKLRGHMRAELALLHERLGKTTLYVTHDQVEAMTLADKIVVLRDGNVEQIGRPLDLYDDPANTFVAGFVGSPKMNFLTGRVAASDGGRATVELVNQNGARLAVPLKQDAPAEGSDVTVGVRPEHFVEGGKGDCDLVLAVDVAEHLGSTSYVYAGTGSREPLIIEREESRHAAADESRLTVGIPARRALLFAKDGKRLR